MERPEDMPSHGIKKCDEKPDAVVVTGMGVISSLGDGIEESFVSLSGSDIAPTFPDISGCTIEKPVFKVQSELLGSKARSMEGNRTLQLANHAVRQAMSRANLFDADTEVPLRIGICAGSTVAGQLNDIDFYSDFKKKQLTSYDAVERYLYGNPAEALKREYRFTGPAITVVNACSSATDAVGVAWDWLLSGQCDVVVAGGADELNRVPLAGFNALGILSASPCRPFDVNRSGLNLGEGAGFLVLETRSSANQRGVSPIVECCAYATVSDGYHLTSPRPDGSGLEAAIKKALSMAGISSDAVGFINAHGTGTATNDLIEGRVFGKLFPNRADGSGLNGNDENKSGVDIWATKGYTGHTLGAAGGIEAVLTVAALQKQTLFKSAGFETLDDAVGIIPVLNEKRICAEYAMSTSLAFGGMNSVLIFRNL